MSEQNWYYLDSQGQQQGPVPPTNLQSLAQAGALTADTQVWTEGLQEWLPASQIEGLLPTPQPQIVNTPAQPQLTPTAPMNPSTPTTQPVQGTPVEAPQENPYSAPQASAQQTGGNYPPTIIKGGSFGKLILFPVLGIFFILIPVLLAGGIAESGRQVSDNEAAGLGLGIMAGIGIGYVLLIIGVILQYIYLYRAWASLQPGGASITPGKSVGFLFIPFFNIYWIFVTYPRLAKEWNEITSRFENTKHAPRMSETGFLLHAIAMFVPFLILVTWFIVHADICKAINFMVNLNRPSFGSPSGGSGLNFGPTTIKTPPP